LAFRLGIPSWRAPSRPAVVAPGIWCGEMQFATGGNDKNKLLAALSRRYAVC
jgi:hypothetical protein